MGYEKKIYDHIANIEKIQKSQLSQPIQQFALFDQQPAQMPQVPDMAEHESMNMNENQTFTYIEAANQMTGQVQMENGLQSVMESSRSIQTPVYLGDHMV